VYWIIKAKPYKQSANNESHGKFTKEKDGLIMNFLGKFKVWIKMIVSFVIIAAMISVVGYIGISNLNSINNNGDEMYNAHLVSVYLLSNTNKNISQVQADFLSLLYDKKTNNNNAMMDIQNCTEDDNKNLIEYEKIPKSGEEKKEWDEFKTNLEQYKSERDNLLKLASDNKYDEAFKQYAQFSKARESIQQSLSKLITENLNAAKSANKENNLIFNKSSKAMLLFIIGGLILAIIFGLLITWDITVPLKKIQHFAHGLSNYDFRQTVNITRKDEFGQTVKSLNKAQENIRELIKGILINSQSLSASSEELSAAVEEMTARFENVDKSTKEIAGGSQELCASAEEITASIEEVNSSINEMSGKALEGSNNANQFKGRALSVRDDGNRAINETAKMYEEREQAILQAIEEGKVVDRIGIMAGTISSIAQQTNLLALNAAIEAARAGEQGRGFAVVADEVRTLAEQSSQAVATIQSTIKEVQEAFNNLSDNSRQVLNFMTGQVKPEFSNFVDTANKYYQDAEFVSGMSEDLASMSEELTATINEVNMAVQNMSATAQNSSESTTDILNSIDDASQGIEQIAQAAQSQAELAQKLNEMIDKFKI
jgi:Methyl-accepting chemotaxis protein